MKPYQEYTEAELTQHAERIARSSNGSSDLIRRRLVSELGYPFSKEGIACHCDDAGIRLMFWTHDGTIINIMERTRK